MSAKKVWKVFWDLECPFAKKNWSRFPAIKQHFQDKFDFEVYLTTLPFHSAAFPAQCAAKRIELNSKVEDAKWKFISKCYENQDRYRNAPDLKPSDLHKILTEIAEEADVFDDTDFTKDKFAVFKPENDWVDTVKPAYLEHKVAVSYALSGTPKHVIDEQVILDTESDWGPAEWEEKLKSLNM